LNAQNSPWATSIVCETTIHDFIVKIQILAVMTDYNELKSTSQASWKFSNITLNIIMTSQKFDFRFSSKLKLEMEKLMCALFSETKIHFAN